MYLESYPAGSQWASFTFPLSLPSPHPRVQPLTLPFLFLFFRFFSFSFLLFFSPIYGFREAQKTQESEKT